MSENKEAVKKIEQRLLRLSLGNIRKLLEEAERILREKEKREVQEMGDSKD